MELWEECGEAAPAGLRCLLLGAVTALEELRRQGLLATRAASLACHFCSALNVSVPLPLMPVGHGRTWLLSAA